MTPTDCCSHSARRLNFPEPLCYRHQSAAQRALVADLDEQAPTVGVTPGCWPYGPNIDVVARVELVAWARANGYKLATPNARCLHWLVGKARRCSALRRQDHAGRIDAWSMNELDHPTFWTRNGKPALILAQPYSAPSSRWVTDVTSTWPVTVEVTATSPWYGHHAYGVLITPDR